MTPKSDPRCHLVLGRRSRNGCHQEANRGTAFLLRQVHLVQECVVARVAAETTQDGINLNPCEPRISVHIGTLEPCECLVLLAAPGIYAGDAVGIVQGDQLLEDSL